MYLIALGKKEGRVAVSNTIQYLGDTRVFPKSDEILCSNQFMVEECLELPCNKLDIERLVETRIQPNIDTYQFIDSPKGKKVYINGNVEQDIMYIADTLCQPVHAVHFKSRFHTFMDLSSCCISNYAALEIHKPRILVEFMEATKLCPRSISKSIILFVWYPTGLIIPAPPQPIHIINPVPTCQVTCKPRRPVKKQRHWECEE